jgi:hypothetical protein
LPPGIVAGSTASTPTCRTTIASVFALRFARQPRTSPAPYPWTGAGNVSGAPFQPIGAVLQGSGWV